MSSPLLTRPGAVEADPPDAGVAAHYGDPFREQRALVGGEASVDLSHRPVVRVAGPDRLTWLHSLTSQHLTGLLPGVATEALLLSPHGHVEHDLRLVDDGSAVWIHVEPGAAAALVAFLESMKFWSQVEVEDLSSSYAVVLRPTGVAGAPTRVRGARRRVLRPARRPRGRARRAARRGVGARRRCGSPTAQPRFGFETDHRTIPHEVGWIGTAVHLDKGCYRGQETVARVHNLGRPPRRLVLLHLDGSDSELPGHGDPVVLDDRTVGTVTSSARHYELGPIALAVVKRSTPADAPLVAGGVAAAQEVLVPA